MYTTGTARSAGVPAPLRSELRTTICAAASQTCTDSLGSRLRALVLTGSLARDEATLIRGEGINTLLGDADFLVVMEPNAPHPTREELDRLEGTVERRLSESGIRAHVGFGAVSMAYFQKLPASSFTYELKNCGKVVWGKQNILDRIPSYAQTELSKEDAWRTLNNRMIELLISTERASPAGDQIDLGLRYAVMKLYLDMATSYLIFAGHYRPTYAARAKQLASLAEPRQLSHSLFDLKRFSERVSECTEWKLTGQGCIANEPLTPLLTEVIGDARGLWHWEAHRLGGNEARTTVRSTIADLGGHQSATEKFRGWTSLARRAGRRATYRNLPRWARLSLIASPRYLIYGSAVQLFWALPQLLANQRSRSDINIDCEQMVSLLPVFARRSTQSQNWHLLVRDIAWNYETFLTGTLA